MDTEFIGSRDEIDNDVYSPARGELACHHVPCPKRRAAQMTYEDSASFDLLIGMDESNLRGMRRIAG